MALGVPWRCRLEPGQSSDRDIPRCFEGLDLWQLVQHVGASNPVQKGGIPEGVSQEAWTAAFPSHLEKGARV